MRLARVADELLDRLGAGACELTEPLPTKTEQRTQQPKQEQIQHRSEDDRAGSMTYVPSVRSRTYLPSELGIRHDPKAGAQLCWFRPASADELIRLGYTFVASSPPGASGFAQRAPLMNTSRRRGGLRWWSRWRWRRGVVSART
jgi:hypothetical protein